MVMVRATSCADLYAVARSAATKGIRGSNRISANDLTVSIRLSACNND